MNTVERYAYDAAIRLEGFYNICGVDEAGRGPLAGPVFAAAVVLNPSCMIDELNDSKKLSEAKREALFEQITRLAGDYAVASASVEEIERLNILQATFLAMTRAVEGLRAPPGHELIDGNRIPAGMALPVRAVVKGDMLSASIAAASILAKVSRDRYLTELDRAYPVYQFAKHKGYGTALHVDLIRKHGPSPVHRRSFLKNIYKAV